MHQRRPVHERVVDVEEGGRGQVRRRCDKAGILLVGDVRNSGLRTGVACQRLHGGFVTIANGHVSTLGHGNVPILVAVNRAKVMLLTRQGCSLCERTAARLSELAEELGFDFVSTDVDAAAAAGDSSLRAEFGDRLPVVLLDQREHSYWELDEPRLRADLGRRNEELTASPIWRPNRLAINLVNVVTMP